MSRATASITNPLSLTATKIFPARRQVDGSILELPIATGFLWLHGGAPHLVTNWHNVAGWDPVNDKALSDNGFTPDVMLVNVGLRLEDNGQYFMRHARIEIELFEDGRPAWFEHPTHGRRVDVVVLPIGDLDAPLWNEPMNAYPDFMDFDVAVGDDAFVLGYPKGLDGGARLPLWKRASIASEPFNDLDGLPKLLIDTATRPGMSGSPVVAVRRGMIHPRGHVGPEPADETAFGTAEMFLGVYSGRVDDDPLGAQLGIVWKGHVIDEILDGGVRGRTPFD